MALLIGMGFFFPGKPVDLCSTKPLWNFAVMNLFPVGNNLLEGVWEKNGRSEFGIIGKFLALPESRCIRRKRMG